MNNNYYILDFVVTWGVSLFSVLSVSYFSYLLFSPNRPRYLEIAGTNNLIKARQMLVEDSKFVCNGFKLLTKTACGPVYNNPQVKKSLNELLSENDISPTQARVIIGPLITTTDNGYNELLKLYQDNKIEIRQLEHTPDQNYRLFGKRLYIEDEHEPHPNATRTFYRMHSVSKYIKKYSGSFDELWNNAQPLDLKSVEKENWIFRGLDRYGKEIWEKENNSSNRENLDCIS